MHFILKKNNLKKIEKIFSTLNEHSISTYLIQKIENLKIICEKNYLNFYLNNLFLNFKLSLSKTEDLEILKEGKVLINLKNFYSFIENLKDNKDFEFFKIEENLLQINSGNFVCNLLTSDSEIDKFDKFDDFDTKKYSKIIFSYKTLKIIYNRFKDFCKLPENNLKNMTILSTINLKKEENEKKIKVLSSDSYKTIFSSFPFDNENQKFNINIFPQTIDILISLFSENEKQDIEMFCSDEDFLIKNNEIFIRSKLFKGNYPSLEKWFNMEINSEFSINKNLLVKAIDRSLLLSNKNLKIAFYRLEDKKLWIEYKNSEKGFSKEHIEIKRLKDKNVDFSLNNDFLKQLIKNINSEEIFFRISESLKPIIIFGEKNDGDFRQFILPLRNY